MNRPHASAVTVWIAVAALTCCGGACSRSHLGDRDPGVDLREPGDSASDHSAGMAPVSTASGTAGTAGGTAGAGSDESPDSATIAANSNELPPAPPRAPTPGNAATPEATPIGLADVPVPQPGIMVEPSAAVPVGVWVGNSRAGVACDPSSRIVLQIAAPIAGRPALATIVFATGPFESSVDPAREFPIGDDLAQLDCRVQRPSAGFVYRAMDGKLTRSGRLSFRVAVTEPYEPWCALQSSASDELANATGYSCAPPMSDVKLASCAACLCFADGCRANLNRTSFFDLQIDGSTMEGVVSIVFSEEAPVEVRLERVVLD